MGQRPMPQVSFELYLADPSGLGPRPLVFGPRIRLIFRAHTSLDFIHGPLAHVLAVLPKNLSRIINLTRIFYFTGPRALRSGFDLMLVATLPKIVWAAN